MEKELKTLKDKYLRMSQLFEWDSPEIMTMVQKINEIESKMK